MTPRRALVDRRGVSAVIVETGEPIAASTRDFVCDGGATRGIRCGRDDAGCGEMGMGGKLMQILLIYCRLSVVPSLRYLLLWSKGMSQSCLCCDDVV